MGKIHFKNSIASILIASFILPLPFVTSVQSALAQPNSGGSSRNASSSRNAVNTNKTNGKGVAPLLNSALISQFILCSKEDLGGAITDLFRKGKTGYKVTGEAADNGNYSLPEDAPESESISDHTNAWSAGDDTFDEATNKALNKSLDVNVYDDAVYEQNQDIKKELKEIKKDTKKTSTSINCYNSLAKAAAQRLAQKWAFSTKEYIESGNAGGPFFVQDPEGFFDDIYKSELKGFKQELSDSTRYPFGRDFIKSKVGSYNNKGFTKIGSYSLDASIKKATPEYSDTDFKGSFSKGGWNAWTSYTQGEGNNPMNFKITADNELSRRVASQSEEANKALDRGDGFLGDKRCADPKGVTKEEDEAARDGEEGLRICNRWEYVTPSSLVSAYAKDTLKFPENSLLRVDGLNDAIAIVVDSLVNRYTPDIQFDGYLSINNEGLDGGLVIDEDNIPNGPDAQTNQDFSKFQRGTAWLQAHPDFNIRTDLTQAIIDEQRTYQRKLQEENIVLSDLNKTIYQLDFCIPGPHPGFENDSREVLSAVEDTIIAKGAGDFENVSEEEIKQIVKATGYAAGAAIGATIGSAIPGLGTVVGAVIGLAIGLLVDLFSGLDNEEKLALYYGQIVETLTGVKLDQDSKIQQKQEVTNALDTMLYRYIQMIHKYYPPEYQTSVRTQAAQEFKRTIGYRQIIADNEDQIAFFDGLIQRLGALKEKIDDLNSHVDTNPNATAPKISSAEYEIQLGDLISEFSRISSGMIDGSDIARVDNILKQSRDKIRYVYEDLLTGEYGCEKDLELKRNQAKATTPDGKEVLVHPAFVEFAGFGGQDKSWIINGTRRAEYPFVVWYDYNLLKDNQEIPVPEGIKQYLTPGKDLPHNKMYDGGGLKDDQKYGPGFLSGIFFDQSDARCGGILDEYKLDCFRVSDLFTYVKRGTGGVPIGRIINNYPAKSGSGKEREAQTLEDTIGVY